MVPSANGPFNAIGVNAAPGAAEGPIGTLLGVPAFVDAAIPLVSSAYPVIASKFSDTILMESGLRTRVLPDVLSANLTVRSIWGRSAA